MRWLKLCSRPVLILVLAVAIPVFVDYETERPDLWGTPEALIFGILLGLVFGLLISLFREDCLRTLKSATLISLAIGLLLGTVITLLLIADVGLVFGLRAGLGFTPSFCVACFASLYKWNRSRMNEAADKNQI